MREHKFPFLLTVLTTVSQKVDELMAELLTKLGLCVILKEIGVKEGEIDVMVEKISGDIIVDPARGEDGICRRLYATAM